MNINLTSAKIADANPNFYLFETFMEGLRKRYRNGNMVHSEFEYYRDLMAQKLDIAMTWYDKKP